MTRDEFNNYAGQLSSKLYRFAFRILRNQEEAEDTAQEVLIKLWGMGKKLDSYRNIDALAATMTKNYCIDQIRKQKHIFQNYDYAQNMDLKSDSPLDLMERTESDKIIKTIIEKMPEQFKILIQFRDIEGMEYDEIAEKTGQNINTIRVTLSRARALLRNEYKIYFNENRGIKQTAKKVL